MVSQRLNLSTNSVYQIKGVLSHETEWRTKLTKLFVKTKYLSYFFFFSEI